MDNFVIYNIPEDKDEIKVKEGEPHKQTAGEDNGDVEISTKNKQNERWTKKVCIPYCVFNLSYVNHSYIPKGRVIAFAEKEKDEENEVFKVEEIRREEEYRNWIPKNKGALPVPSELDFI